MLLFSGASFWEATGQACYCLAMAQHSERVRERSIFIWRWGVLLEFAAGVYYYSAMGAGWSSFSGGAALCAGVIIVVFI